MRPWTPTVVREGGKTLTMKRMCSGCRRALGDVTTEEMDAVVAGRALPDTTSECGCDPDQPPGIRQDYIEDPPVTAAAERARDFLQMFGDGRIAVAGDVVVLDVDDPLHDAALAYSGTPLYARDLQALIVHALTTTQPKDAP